MKILKKSLLLTLIALTVVFGIFSCARQVGEPDMFGAKTISQGDIFISLGFNTNLCGKDTYAVVNKAWVEWYYIQFYQTISAGQYGVTQWSPDFTCTAFTAKFVADAQLNYFRRAWGTSMAEKASGLAMGEFWFHPTPTTGHAVVACFTVESGLSFFEPQTGKWITITPEQQSSSYLKKFN